MGFVCTAFGTYGGNLIYDRIKQRQCLEEGRDKINRSHCTRIFMSCIHGCKNWGIDWVGGIQQDLILRSDHSDRRDRVRRLVSPVELVISDTLKA